MSCCALKSNLAQCRNWACDGQSYCHTHCKTPTEVFKDRWVQRFLVGTPQYPVYTFLRPTNEKQILSDLTSGKVKLSAADILKIPKRESHVDIYLLLVEHGLVERGTHKSLEFVAYWLYMYLLMAHPNQDPLPLTRKRIESFLILDSGKGLYFFLWFVCGPALNRPRLLQLLVRLVPTLLDTDAAKELSWFARDELDKLRIEYEKILGADHPLTKCLVQRWLLDLKELYQTEKAVQKIKMDQCKEELMMNRWHPSRVEKLLLAGIEPEDM
jgi:hypothetical protein